MLIMRPWLGVCGQGGGDGVCLQRLLTTTADPHGPRGLSRVGLKAVTLCVLLLLLHECVYVPNE